MIDYSIQSSGFHPDTGSILGVACAGSQYEDFIQIYAPDTVSVGGGLYAVNYVKLDSIPDLPAGLTYSTNPSNGSMAGGERGCVSIFGSVNAAPGIYSITIFYTANFELFGGTSLYFTAPYKIQVISGASTSFSFNDTICAFENYAFHGSQLSSSGIYLDTLTNQTGCDSLITLHLLVKPFDTLVYTENGTVHAPAGYSNYQWYECGTGNLLAGGDSVFSNLWQVAGCYVTYGNVDCNYTSSCILPSSLSGLELNDFWQVYPNPGSGSIWVDFKGELPRFVRIMDPLGRVVFTSRKPEKLNRIFTADFPPATYLLAAQFDNYLAYKKVVLY
ncbi:MAG: T9SS type A sorting domain-containing protein [Bacteroidetes bacterium]|nr:T9SS type A sorting domain-containing protein [Bacteroidota bacterium]